MAAITSDRCDAGISGTTRRAPAASYTTTRSRSPSCSSAVSASAFVSGPRPSITMAMSSPQRAVPSAAGAMTSMRTSISPPHDGTRVSLGRRLTASPVVARTVGELVLVKRPFAGTMNPTGARHGSYGSRCTTRSGTSAVSWNSTPLAVTMAAPCAPGSWKSRVPSRATMGLAHAHARTTGIRARARRTSAA